MRRIPKHTPPDDLERRGEELLALGLADLEQRVREGRPLRGAGAPLVAAREYLERAQRAREGAARGRRGAGP